MASDGDTVVRPSGAARWVGVSPALGSDLVEFAFDHAARGTTDAWFDGAGEVAEPVLELATETGERVTRSLPGVWDLVSLRGAITRSGATNLHVLVAREGAAGPQLVGGLLRSARVVRVDLLVCTADAEDRPASAVAPAPAPARILEDRRSSPGTAAPPLAPAPSPSSPGTPHAPHPPTAMPKPLRTTTESVEVYPEEGDTVNHFAFGRCMVVFSDGERIRLQQDKDSRVREVALSMLRVGEPTPVGDKRHWELTRKN